MTKALIKTDKAPLPIGPYAQAIRTGNLIFTAGQGPIDPATQQVVPGGIKEQTTRTLENLKAILEAAGSGMDRVVKATVFVKDLNDFAAMNAIYATYLGADRVTPPARSTVEVARLPKDTLVEIELIAEV